MQRVNSQMMSQLSTVRPGWETLDYSLYDYQAYAAAGQTQLNFFAVPAGQAGKTLSDTNMQLAAQLPANLSFVIQGIEVEFFPTVPGVAAANPSAFGAQAVAAQVNDSYIVRRTGNLTLNIGTKSYTQEGPLARFPAASRFEITGALTDTSTAGAALQSRTLMANVAGRLYKLKIPLPLEPTQSFGVSVAWPEGVQAITNPGRLGVILTGILRRRN